MLGNSIQVFSQEKKIHLNFNIAAHALQCTVIEKDHPCPLFLVTFAMRSEWRVLAHLSKEEYERLHGTPQSH